MANEKKTQDRDHLNDHLIEWAPLINLHVNKLRDGLPPHIDHEDLYAAGMHGLIDAFHKYDPKKGASFKSHASKRIQGMMKDHISANDVNSVDKYHYTEAKKFKENQAAKANAPAEPNISTEPKIKPE